MKKYKKLLMILAVCSLAVAAVGCSSAQGNQKEETSAGQEVSTEVATDEVKEAETVTITHKYGEVTVPKNPTSVAITDFGLLDTLQRLGVEVVTGVSQDTSSVPEYLGEYMSDKYTNIGGLKEPNFEVLYELAPEIIFISGRQASQYEELSKIAPVVYMEIDQTNYMESLQENVTLLGEVFGKEAEASSILTELNDKAEAIKALATEQEVSGLITMVNKGEVSVFGANSRFGIIHNSLGIKPADEKIDDSTHGQTVTFEYLAEVNPQYLFVVDRNAIGESSETAKDTLNNALVNNMTAAKEDRIIYLDPVAWYITSGGITASEIMVNEVGTAIGLN